MKFILSGRDDTAEYHKYVIVSMDITETGKARNVQVLETNPPDDSSLGRQVRRSLKTTRFRPRYENGQAVKTTGVNLRYVFE